MSVTFLPFPPPGYKTRPQLFFYVFPNMPFPFVQSHSVDLCNKNRVLFFEENWNLKIKAVVCPQTSVFLLFKDTRNSIYTYNTI